MRPDRDVPEWIWAVSGAAVIAAVVVAWLLPSTTDGASADADPAVFTAARAGVARDGFLVARRGGSGLEFDVRKCLVKPEDLLALMPGRDGVPALERPVFVRAQECVSVRPDELVLGIKVGSDARCYPLRILAWHTAVNDTVGGKPVVISFDPISNAGVAALASAPDGTILRFGVAGRAYAGEGLLFDRQTSSLWAMLRGKAISGSYSGEKLRRIGIGRMTYAEWRRQHAKTQVLCEDTGFDRPYEDDPYSHALVGTDGKSVDYWREEHAAIVPLPKGTQLGKFRAKELVLGVDVNGVTKAYPLSELARCHAPVQEQLGGQTFQVKYDPGGHCATVTPVKAWLEPFAVVCFWGSWRAAHPNSDVYEAPRQAPGVGAEAQV